MTGNFGSLVPGEADHLGLSETSLRRYIAQGLITGYRLGQRSLIRVDLLEVESRLLTPIPTEAIKREAEADPPLSQEQRNKLAMLLLQSGGSEPLPKVRTGPGWGPAHQETMRLRAMDSALSLPPAGRWPR